MKRLMLLLLLCVGTFCAHAQQYFNVRNTLHSFACQLRSVVVQNDKYYVAGYGYDSVNDQHNGFALNILGIKFAAFDQYGNKLFDTVWQKPHRQIELASNNLRVLPDHSFLLAMDDIDTLGFYHKLLADFDSTGHMLWNREYDRPFCIGATPDFWRLVDFKPTGTGEWLMFSTLGCSPSGSPASYNADFLLTKLDSNFNVLWHQKYGSPYNNDLAGKLLIEPDGYIMGGRGEQ